MMHTPLRAPRASLIALSALLLTACASAPRAPVVPDTLKPPAAQTLTLETLAVGVQIYECQASKTDPARHEWVFKAPEAALTDRAGRSLGKHYAGPTWEGNDGSKVAGAVKANAASPDANAIPWLLLGSKANSGSGLFGRTQSIQRVATVGGKAPAPSCAAAEAGKEARVAYTATYYFYD